MHLILVLGRLWDYVIALTGIVKNDLQFYKHVIEITFENIIVKLLSTKPNISLKVSLLNFFH